MSDRSPAEDRLSQRLRELADFAELESVDATPDPAPRSLDAHRPAARRHRALAAAAVVVTLAGVVATAVTVRSSNHVHTSTPSTTSTTSTTSAVPASISTTTTAAVTAVPGPIAAATAVTPHLLPLYGPTGFDRTRLAISVNTQGTVSGPWEQAYLATSDTDPASLVISEDTFSAGSVVPSNETINDQPALVDDAPVRVEWSLPSGARLVLDASGVSVSDAVALARSVTARTDRAGWETGSLPAGLHALGEGRSTSSQATLEVIEQTWHASENRQIHISVGPMPLHRVVPATSLPPTGGSTTTADVNGHRATFVDAGPAPAPLGATGYRAWIVFWEQEPGSWVRIEADGLNVGEIHQVAKELVSADPVTWQAYLDLPASNDGTGRRFPTQDLDVGPFVPGIRGGFAGQEDAFCRQVVRETWSQGLRVIVAKPIGGSPPSGCEVDYSYGSTTTANYVVAARLAASTDPAWSYGPTHDKDETVTTRWTGSTIYHDPTGPNRGGSHRPQVIVHRSDGAEYAVVGAAGSDPFSPLGVATHLDDAAQIGFGLGLAPVPIDARAYTDAEAAKAPGTEVFRAPPAGSTPHLTAADIQAAVRMIRRQELDRPGITLHARFGVFRGEPAWTVAIDGVCIPSSPMSLGGLPIEGPPQPIGDCGGTVGSTFLIIADSDGRLLPDS